ncbi:MAG: hypothetical protein COA52_06380 [Hyphomicrobiales bacterium]|nr:DUF2164 domain-containing protein [Hyphomicrobiales bacterium]PCJ93506.1 MAG: hypothetical protein COA52_06380 [Hyphomicrobiales bacterium]
MKKVEFSKEDTAEMTRHIQRYFSTELDQEIGDLGAELLLEFFGEKIGAYFYNQGLHDAQAVLATKMDDVIEAIYTIEQPTNR